MTPVIEVRRWRVMRVKMPSQVAHRFHVVGYVLSADDGFVSGAIKRYNPDTRTVVTTSGDKVQLSGPHGGLSRDADRAFSIWCRKKKVTDLMDVSSRYLAPKRKRSKTTETPGQNTAKA